MCFGVKPNFEFLFFQSFLHRLGVSTDVEWVYYIGSSIIDIISLHIISKMSPHVFYVSYVLTDVLSCCSLCFFY